MSVLLYIIGGLAFALGAITIGFGSSIELSFGNSLIVAGTSAAVGGLIVIGLAGVVSQLKRIAEALGAQMPDRPIRPAEMLEGRGGPQAAGRVPFPTRPKSGTPRPPQPAASPLAMPAVEEKPAADQFAAVPTLPNPDVAPVEVHEQISLSPFQPAAPPAPAEKEEAARHALPFGLGAVGERQAEPEVDHGWRLPPIPRRPRSEEPRPTVAEEPSALPPGAQAMHFDTLRRTAGPEAVEPKSAELKSAQPKSAESAGRAEVEPKIEAEAAPEPVLQPEPEPRAGPMAELKAESEFARKAEPPPAVEPASARPAEPEQHDEGGKPHNVPILKSGVVDGMGYTLYVDGSIEAELPQGTLRFTSINDLRNYLEQNGGT